MKRVLILMPFLAVPGLALAQAPAPSDKPPAIAEKPAAHDMQRMHGMMAGMRPPVCVYESKGYSRGALINARGVKPMLECAAVETDAHAGHGAGGGHDGHGAAQLTWRVYGAGKAPAPRQTHEHKH